MSFNGYKIYKEDNYLQREAASISRNLGGFGHWFMGNPGGKANIAARAAAANPRRPTPAIPASPPDLVSMFTSLSGTRETARSPVPAAGIGGGGGRGDDPEGEEFTAEYGVPEWVEEIGDRTEALEVERARPSVGWGLIGRPGLSEEVA